MVWVHTHTNGFGICNGLGVWNVLLFGLELVFWNGFGIGMDLVFRTDLVLKLALGLDLLVVLGVMVGLCLDHGD